MYKCVYIYTYGKVLLKRFLKFCVYERFACMYEFTLYVCTHRAIGGQVLDLLELEL